MLGRRARFVAELAHVVHADALSLERALGELEQDGAVLVREQYCGDPHLVGTDLRIAALMPQSDQGGDALATANAQIEATWQRWLGEYLASHRCT